MDKEPYLEYQSLNWVQLTKSEYFFVAINYCFIKLADFNRDLFDNGYGWQIESSGGSSEYSIFKARIWKKGMLEFTQEDKDTIEKYLKNFERQQRDIKWK